MRLGVKTNTYLVHKMFLLLTENFPGDDSCDENNGDCEHLCLYLPFLGRKKCFCNQDLKLKENGKTCGKEELQNQGE